MEASVAQGPGQVRTAQPAFSFTCSSRSAVGAAARRVLSDVEDGFLQGLCVAAAQGEITSTLDLPGWAAALTMLVQGLQVVAKADPDPRRLTRGVDAVLASLRAGA
jgi:TetR/AcrR family transcriptional repressor of nem operon